MLWGSEQKQVAAWKGNGFIQANPEERRKTTQGRTSVCCSQGNCSLMPGLRKPQVLTLTLLDPGACNGLSVSSWES